MKRYFPIFVLPTLLAFAVAFMVPFIMGIYLSFCDFTTVTNAKFVGISNYVKAFTNPDEPEYTPPHSPRSDDPAVPVRSFRD